MSMYMYIYIHIADKHTHTHTDPFCKTHNACISQVVTRAFVCFHKHFPSMFLKWHGVIVEMPQERSTASLRDDSLTHSSPW